MKNKRYYLSVKMWLFFVCVCFLYTPKQSANADCFGGNGSNIDNLAVFASKWLDTCSEPNWCLGADVDQDQRVNFVDYSIIFGDIDPLVLFENGICRVSIKNVVQGSVSTTEAYAAVQLQNAFYFATGVSPQINPSTPAEIEIKLGLAARFSSEIGSTSDQAYAIRRTIDGDIELVGNSTAAVLWAVTDFAESVLHVSWPTADDNMVLEGSAESSVVFDQTCRLETPDFVRRGWILGENTNGYGYENKIDNWMSHNKQNATTVAYPYLADGNDSLNPKDKLLERGISADTTMHSFYWLVPVSLFDTHPEYFPLIDGVRVPSTGGTGPQLCISNAAVRTIIKKAAYSAFKLNPKLKCFGIVPNDSSEDGWCQCSACQALDGAQAGTGVYSNRLMSLVNYVADALYSYFPDNYIGTLAYSDYRQAPDVNVSDNVFITFCTGGRNLMRKLTDPCDTANSSIMQELNGWLSKAENVSLWEYYWYSGLDKCPAPFSHTLIQEFSDLKALGVKGVTSQTVSGFWPGLRLPCYAFAHATWDTSLTFDEILTDYCSKRYGPAATIMKLYHNTYEGTITDHVSTLRAIQGAGEQYIPWAFTTAELSTLDEYLTNAANTVNLNTSQASAIAEDREMFDSMCALRTDPATISGIGANIIPNPGAESGQLNWSTHTFSPEYSFSVPTGDAHSGNRCLKIECTGTPSSEQGRWYQEGLTIQDGEKYAIRFWVRADGQAWGNVVCYFGSNVIEIGVGDSNDQWVQVVCPEVTANGSSLSIYLQSYGPGNIFYDDVFVAVLPD